MTTLKRVKEGYLYCSPYVGDRWFLAKEKREIEKHGELEIPKEHLEDIDIAEIFDNVEGKKVKITMELME